MGREMTALRKYERLESPGLWRESAADQRREVIVSVREATLVLSDPRSEMPLAHWSIPAVERMNPGVSPAHFRPSGSDDESLEISDRDMIAALETLHRSVLRRGPRPWRLRGAVLAGSAAVVAAFGFFWLPGAMVRHTVSVLPEPTRLGIGLLALEDFKRLSGSPCDADLGAAAAQRLADGIFGKAGPRLVILRDGLQGAVALPGGLILLGRSLLEKADGPEIAAGYALAAALRAEEKDPMLAILDHAGTAATFRLLTTGRLPESAIHGFADGVLATPVAPVDAETLLARFAQARVPSSPYAYTIDSTGETVLPLIEADPFRNTQTAPLLSDGDWVSLQEICLE